MYVEHFDWQVPMHGVADGVLSLDDCAQLIATATISTWLPATINGPDGRYRNERVRNNDLALIADAALAARLTERVAAAVPPKMFGLAFHSIHPSLRVYRYQPGQYFAPHSDQPYFDDAGRQSRLTLIVYLDSACVNGSSGEPPLVIAPTVGKLLWFQHMLVHEGRRVESGIKHVLRTDAIYA
jgi:hypothetical protein